MDSGLISYVTNRDFSGLKEAIRRGANIEAHDEFGMTALMYASWTGQVAIVEELVRSGASPNAVDSSGNTALLLAMETFCDVETVRLLLSAGADVNVNPGVTPLMRAVVNTDEEIVGALLEAGADVKARGSEGETALIRAAMVRDNVLVIRRLLESGADVNSTDRNRHTALINVAAWSGNPTMANDLLNVGADAFVRCIHGKTAQQYAHEKGHVGVEQLIAGKIG